MREMRLMTLDNCLTGVNQTLNEEASYTVPNAMTTRNNDTEERRRGNTIHILTGLKEVYTRTPITATHKTKDNPPDIDGCPKISKRNLTQLEIRTRRDCEWNQNPTRLPSKQQHRWQ